MSDWLGSTVPEDPPSASPRSCGTGATTELACICWSPRQSRFRQFDGDFLYSSWILLYKPDYQFSL